MQVTHRSQMINCKKSTEKKALYINKRYKSKYISLYYVKKMTDLLIGAIAGAVSRTATAPLELYKIQGQNRYMPYSTIKDTLTKEGLRGLWKGNLINCLRVSPQMAVSYAVYSFTNQNIFNKLPKSYQKYRHFLSGAMGGVVSMVSIYPLENARSRLTLQTNNSHYNGITDVFKRTSIRELYAGVKMSVIGFTPYSAMSFGFYHMFKQYFAETYKWTNSTSHLMSGGLSGLIALSFVYPTDLIRRRLQLQGFDPSVPKYNGILDSIRKIYAHEGIPGFYRGLVPNYIKLFPTIAIQFWTLEYLRNLIYDTDK